MSERTTQRNVRTRVRAGAVAVALGAATTALGGVVAPDAGATVSRLGALPGVNFGAATNYGTGCTSTLHAIVDDPVAPVTFYDNGAVLATIAPSGGGAFLNWVPATTGVHHLAAVQGPDDQVVATLDLRVGTGMHMGTGCNVFGG